MGTVILAEGGSNTVGWCDTEKHGWVSRINMGFMGDFTDARAPYRTITNLGASNALLPNMVDSLPTDISRFSDPGPANHVIAMFMVGCSDSAIPKGKAESAVSLNRFETSLRKLGATCLQLGAKPFFVGTPAISTVRYGKRFEAARIIEYTNAVRCYAREIGAPFVEPIVLSDAKGNLAPDRIHPNPQGHAEIAAVVGPVLTAYCASVESIPHVGSPQSPAPNTRINSL